MTLEELEKNVQILEDMNAIENMHRDFIYWLNNRQSEEWLNEIEFVKRIDCFTDDAETEINPYGKRKGRVEINRMLKELADDAAASGGRCIITQPVIDVDGDGASGRWVMYRFTEIPASSPNTKEVTGWEQGECICRYVKQNGEWRFSEMKLTSPWPIPD